MPAPDDLRPPRRRPAAARRAATVAGMLLTAAVAVAAPAPAPAVAQASPSAPPAPAAPAAPAAPGVPAASPAATAAAPPAGDGAAADLRATAPAPSGRATRPAPRLERPVGGAPTPARAHVARVLLPTVARSEPRRGARVVRRVSPYGPYDRDPQSLLVLEARATRTGPWYRVLLPVRPNGTSGWVDGRALRVTATPVRVRIDLSDRTLQVLTRGRVTRRWTVAVGTRANPTPTGLFAISEIVPQRPADGFFGPYIMTLTAHSARLSDFDGGEGQVAVHGTSLPGLLGRAVSHGCVRMPDDGIRDLARRVPRGAPVEIVP